METSRIVVKGLPPSLTEADFKTHFSQKFQLTDCRCFPARRLGFVGFATTEDAVKAVRYFNKSFLRMSRIRVELANNDERSDKICAIKQRETGRNNTSLNGTAHGQPTSLKRKRETDGHAMDSPRVMDHSSYRVDHSSAAATVPDQGMRSGPMDGIEHDSTNVTRASSNEAAEQSSPTGPTEMDALENSANDDDWMRSRTTRLLGLDENEDDDEGGGITVPSHWSSELEAEPSPNRSPAGSSEGGPHDQANDVRDAEGDEQSSRPAILEEVPTYRLFVRNLPFSVKEADLQELFGRIGEIIEITLPQNFKTGTSKGIAFVQYRKQTDASTALKQLDGSTFQGRLLHVMAANHKQTEKANDYALSQLPLKKQKIAQKKTQNASSTFNWNHLFMNIDAVMASVANSLGVSKSNLLDPSSADAAVKQAQAETHVIRETKTYLQKNGVDLKSFEIPDRNGNGLLVKNFPYGTTGDELRELFSSAGDIKRVLMPPSGTIAIIEFAYADQAKHARHAFAYRKFKGSVIYPEQAPAKLFSDKSSIEEDTHVSQMSPATNESMTERPLTTSTLFVRNLNFATTNERLGEIFSPLKGFWSARVKTKPDPKNKGKTLSMGFGFLEFQSKSEAQAALEAMSGFTLDGHRLEIKESHNGQDLAEQRREDDLNKKRRANKTKLVVKNLPFETTKHDVRTLFRSYGQLKSVRLPKKIDNSRKGFAFAEFTSPREAENAFNALRNTHLLGRRLVLDYAAEEAEDPEAEIAKMQQKVGKQSDSIAVQRLAASDRRKFTLGTGEHDEGN